MNKFAIVFLMLFMGIIIIVGILAIQNDVSTDSRASNTCPPQTFPENSECPSGESMQLVEGTNGCYSFQCQ